MTAVPLVQVKYLESALTPPVLISHIKSNSRCRFLDVQVLFRIGQLLSTPAGTSLVQADIVSRSIVGV